jgi:hypothetical protein
VSVLQDDSSRRQEGLSNVQEGRSQRRSIESGQIRDAEPGEAEGTSHHCLLDRGACSDRNERCRLFTVAAVLLCSGGDPATAPRRGVGAGPHRRRSVSPRSDTVEDHPRASASSSKDNASPSRARFATLSSFRQGRKAAAIGGE